MRPPVSAIPNPVDNVATDITSITPTGDLSITKTDGLTSIAAGEVVTYTIVATNAGPSPIVGARVADTVPAVLLGATWTCSASAGSACTNASGIGNINELVDLAAVGQVTFSDHRHRQSICRGPVSCRTPRPSPHRSGRSTRRPPTTRRPTPRRSSAVPIWRSPRTDSTVTAVAGSTTTYSIVVTNLGPSNTVGATVDDLVPAGVTASNWTCVATTGASCTRCRHRRDLDRRRSRCRCVGHLHGRGRSRRSGDRPADQHGNGDRADGCH